MADPVVTFHNSIAANSTSGSDVHGDFDARYSLIEDNTGPGTRSGIGNIIGQDPLLGPLADNGGPTLTYLPDAGSPVIDAGDATLSPFGYDQRSLDRPQGAAVDMGSVEVRAPPVISNLTIAPTPFGEGATSTLTVYADQAVTADTFVTIDFSGAATYGTDFTSTDADGGTAGVQVLIMSGQTSGSVTLSATTDMVFEGDEVLTATTGAVTGGGADAPPAALTADATITDADMAPTITIDSVSVDESAGTAVFTVTLSNASATDTTVTYETTDGTATAGLDYTTTAGTLNFAAGDPLTQTISVPIIDDVFDEPNETFVVLASPTGGTLGATRTGVGTILDNDGPASLSIADVTVNEGDGTAIFTVTLSGTAGGAVTVNYTTVDGTATSPADYTTTAGTLNFAPGTMTQTIMVPIIDDAAVEGVENFTVDLSVPIGAEIGDGSAIGTINDNDGAASLLFRDGFETKATARQSSP